MFFEKLKARVRTLEERLDAMKINSNCEKNVHDWEMVVDSSTRPKPPYIRCKYCWERPSQPTN